MNKKSLASILGLREAEDEVKDTGSGHRTNPKSNSNRTPSDDESDDDELPEDETRKFLEEMEGSDAEIDDIKSLDHLLKNPQEGSVIMAFKDPKRRTKAHLIKFATDSYIPNLLPILFSDDTPMEMYTIFRMVLPHKRAVAVAEKIGILAKESGMTPTEVLAEISGLDIKTRGDLKKVLTKILSYHPHISSVLSGLFKKVQTMAR